MIRQGIDSGKIQFFPGKCKNCLTHFRGQSLSLSVRIDQISQFQFHGIRKFPVLESCPADQFPRSFIKNQPHPISIVSVHIGNICLLIFFFFFLCKQWFNKSRNPLSVCIQAPCYPFFLIQFFQSGKIFQRQFPDHAPFRARNLPRLAMASLKNPLQKFIIHFLKTFNHHPGARITLFRKCRICIGSHRHMRTDCRLNPGICRRNQEDFLCMKFPHSKRFFRYVFHRKYRKVCGQLQRIPFFLLIDQCL